MSPPNVVQRAVGLLARPEAWIEELDGRYLLRLSPDRRRRPALSFGADIFEALTLEPGLRRLNGGGYAPSRTRAPEPAARRRGARSAAPDAAGVPGVLLGERPVVEPDGRMILRAANLTESPVAWLARRKDARGEPWLDRPHVAAAEKLRQDWVAAGQIGRLTMAWDAGPKQTGARGPGDSAERSRAAKERLRRALESMGPGLQEIVERTCLLGHAVDDAEKALRLPRRAGKAVLRLALERLARHYRIG